MRSSSIRVAVVAALLGGCMVGSPPREVSGDEPLPDDLVAGDVVRIGDVGIIVPPPGMAVGMTADKEDGTVVDLAIVNPAIGAVHIAESVRPEAGPLVIANAAPDQCKDGAYKLEGSHWAQPMTWFFNDATTPAANSRTNVTNGLLVGANAITTQRNACGFADLVTAQHVYAGTTTLKPNLTSSTTAVTCGDTDGSNVVAFGPLPSGYLAITCYWYNPDNNTNIEADIRFATGNKWFALGVPTGCSNKWGIEQVATHEFGHAFGLGHVAQSTHPELTMAPQSLPCTNAHVSLGLGDVRGLRALYP
jgi:hypothetical protein